MSTHTTTLTPTKRSAPWTLLRAKCSLCLRYTPAIISVFLNSYRESSLTMTCLHHLTKGVPLHRKCPLPFSCCVNTLRMTGRRTRIYSFSQTDSLIGNSPLVRNLASSCCSQLTGMNRVGAAALCAGRTFLFCLPYRRNCNFVVM